MQSYKKPRLIRQIVKIVCIVFCQPDHVCQQIPFFKIPVKDQLFCFHLVVFSLSAYPAVFNRLVISQNLHVRGLFPKSPQRVLHGAVFQISLEIQEEPVFPRPSLDRTTLDLCQI